MATEAAKNGREGSAIQRTIADDGEAHYTAQHRPLECPPCRSTHALRRCAQASRSKRAQQRRMATLAPAATEPVTSDYVRVRRQMTTTFLWVDPANTAADLKAKIHKITKVPANDIKLFIDKTGDVVLDETKSLADQKACRTPMPLLHGGPCRKRWFAGVCCRRLTTTRSSSWCIGRRVRAQCPGKSSNASDMPALTPPERHAPATILPTAARHPAQEERASGRRSRSGRPPRLRVCQADVPCVHKWYTHCGGRL